MVKVRFGNRKAKLRFLDNRVAVYNSEGRLIGPMDCDFRSAADALMWLAEHWKIRHFWQYDSNDPEDVTPIYPEERIITELKTVGDLTLTEELDWLMFNRLMFVYNVLDDRLWVIDSRGTDFNELPRVKGAEEISTLPCHRPIHEEKWSVPEFPDQHYHHFLEILQKKLNNPSISYHDQAGHYTVAQLERATCFSPFPAVEIRRDETIKLSRVTKLLGTLVRTKFTNTGDGTKINCILATAEACMKDSWDSLFPEEWDVAMVKGEDFFNHTFAGHCYQHENFVGMQRAPDGHTIAWENRYGDMLLLRLGKNSTIRCPPEYKGKIIGTAGVNIKRVAKMLGKEHWWVRLV